MTPPAEEQNQKTIIGAWKSPQRGRQILKLTTALSACSLALLSVPSGNAYAAEPVTFEGPISDTTGFLSSEQATEISAAITVATDHNLAVHFATVPDFDSYDPLDWCLQTATQSDLPEQAVIFAVAYDQRQATHCTTGNAATMIVTDAQIGAAFAYAIDNLANSNPLAAEDLTAAALDFTNQLVESASAVAPAPSATSSQPAPAATTHRPPRAPRPTVTNQAQPSNPSNVSAAQGLLVILLGCSLIAGTVALFFYLRQRKSLRPDPIRPNSPAASNGRINYARHQLFHANQIISNAEVEHEKAGSKPNSSNAYAYAMAISEARHRLTVAFGLLPQLDAVQIPLRARVRHANNILITVDETMRRFSERQEALHQRRAREATAEQEIQYLQSRIDEVKGVLEAARQHLNGLTATYPPSFLDFISGNPAQAQTLLDKASATHASAKELLASDRAAVIDHVDDAHHSVSLALPLIDAVRNARETIENAYILLSKAISSIISDLHDLHRLAPNQPACETLINSANAAIATGQAALRREVDPITALKVIRQAEDPLDRVLARLREAEEERRQEIINGFLVTTPSTIVTELVSGGNHDIQPSRSEVASPRNQERRGQASSGRTKKTRSGSSSSGGVAKTRSSSQSRGGSSGFGSGGSKSFGGSGKARGGSSGFGSGSKGKGRGGSSGFGSGSKGKGRGGSSSF